MIKHIHESYLQKAFSRFSLLLACCLTLIGSHVIAHEVALDTSMQGISDVNITQMRLPNGMNVWLKPTSFEQDEVFVKLAALGGFASLPPKDRFSGEFAAQIAWESGMGGYTSDQISVLLYEHSMDFVPKIQAFNRTIEGASCKEGLEAFLKCVQMMFMEQNFTEDGLKAARGIAKSTLHKLTCDYEQAYEAAFLQVNTQGLQSLQPMTVEDLSKVDFNVSKQFFRRCFSDPSEFVCVIVGSFDIAEAKSLVNRYLGAIPRSNERGGNDFKQAIAVPFPQGITQRELRLIQRPDSLTHLTFPLLIPLDETSIGKISFCCQVIEARLRRMIMQRMDLSYGVDVSYEFPLYPFLTSPWISIRFRCDIKFIDEVKFIIIKELQRLQERGATEAEIEEIKKLEAGSEEYWLSDNFYWTSMLTNYYLWQWNPESIYQGSKGKNDLSVDMINGLLKRIFSLSQYSVITAKP